MSERNPKQEGTKIFDCVPQTGLCPHNCNQCFYNKPGAFFTDIQKPHFPSIEEVGDGIVRVNSGHDSNIERKMVIDSTERYKERFFNTSIHKFNFPAPVVFTANTNEEEPATIVYCQPNIMFVRLRVSPTNLTDIKEAVGYYSELCIPIVLTFMRYYDDYDNVMKTIKDFGWYEYKKHILNSYWCPTEKFMRKVRHEFSGYSLVSICGSYESSLCKDCGNCWNYYWITKKRMEELK